MTKEEPRPLSYTQWTPDAASLAVSDETALVTVKLSETGALSAHLLSRVLHRLTGDEISDAYRQGVTKGMEEVIAFLRAEGYAHSARQISKHFGVTGDSE